MGGYSRESGDGDTKKVGFVWCVWCFVCTQYYPHRLWCFLVDAVLTQRKSVYTGQTDRLGVLFVWNTTQRARKQFDACQTRQSQSGVLVAFATTLSNFAKCEICEMALLELPNCHQQSTHFGVNTHTRAKATPTLSLSLALS